ncbi:MAG: hypothetical protein K9W46_02110 [Candidatus Heimdallarchaeum endolithica]|uniref:site-specific DNA-methyltransferase (adenine-specific) n=1 Tax=Candidatus Heimdallarchaeum endolithica TaxID=2876572 RepID=A0A9Y1BRZ4_9ARCH|nr:MAG: hypothetical protein K9W46_02110 [Candidatus Heimdallarchaeum endolithica]
MEIREILDSKNNLILFLKSKGFEEEVSYTDMEYKEVVFLKLSKRKLLTVCEAFNEEKIKEIKNHFLIDRGLTHVAIFLKEKIVFFRNYGERRYFIYSKRTAENISKINKLKKIGENFDIIFQTKDISRTFYEHFKLKRDLLVRSITNKIDPIKKYLITQKIFDRIFFIYFLCHKKIIKFSDGNQISGKVFFDILVESNDFTENLKKTFNLFNTPHKQNILTVGNYKIRIPYLNGGLFREIDEEKRLQISLKKKDWLKIFEFLNSYYWIIESEVEELTEEIEEEEAKILTPEILGHVYERSVVEWELKGFEKEVEDVTKGESERKKKGVYYTPEEITDYISKKTIYPFLLNKLGGDFKDISDFLKKASDSQIIRALKIISEIKVLDPACGSGAFLLKAGEVLFYLKTALLNKLGNRPNYYEIKHEIITENLYGVDILDGAIEIAKLRLWLWLVSSYKEEKEIQALPNIEYNLVVGNSLIGWLNDSLTQISLINPMTPEIKGIFKGLIANSINEKQELKKAKELLEKINLDGYIKSYYILYTIYKRAHGERAIHLKEILQTIRAAIYKSINQALLNHFNKKINPNHNPKNLPISISDFENLNPLHWRIDFGHIIKKGGFDIIIGNPPYGSNFSEIESKILKIKFPFHTSRIKNSAMFFIYRGKQLLNDESYFSYIVPKSLCYSLGWNLTADFINSNLIRLIDVGKAFEDVKLEQVIFVIDLNKKSNKYISGLYYNNKIKEVSKIGKSVLKDYQVLLAGLFEEELSIILFIMNKFKKRWGDYLTLKRGLNWQKLAKKLKGTTPIFRGKQLNKYCLKEPTDFIDLKKFDFNEYNYQLNPKILNQLAIAHVMNPYPHFYLQSVYDPEGLLVYETISCTFTKNTKLDLKFVLIINNSKLFAWLLYKFIYSNAIRSTRYDEIYVRRVPVPELLKVEQHIFIKLANVLIFLNQYFYDKFVSKSQINKKIEEKISFFDELANCLVYELYLKEKLKTDLTSLIENKFEYIELDNWLKLRYNDNLSLAELKKKEEIEERNLNIIDKVFTNFKSSKEISYEMRKIKDSREVMIIEGRINSS